jgi:diketogulonate reductase-like aldo/keto reductase
MELRLFGSTKRFVARIGQGTWFIEDAHRDIAIAALRRGLDLGMTHIDTAELYGGGAAEELVGEAIAGRRNEVFLVSKVLPENASQSGTRLACERSLARLDTDRLDCYLLHWRGRHPSKRRLPASKTFSAQARSSPCQHARPQDALAIAGQGEGRLACNQVLYHLQERAIEHAVLPWCERHGVAVTAYSPFGHGNFPGSGTEGGRVLAKIAAAYEATPRQVALAFLTRRPSLFAIPKASTPAHAEENAGAGDLQLFNRRCLIDAVSPRNFSYALPVL